MSSSRERDSTPPSLLIAAHCSTIQRSAKYLETTELSAIFDDLVRELNTKNLSHSTYLNSLNEVVKILNSTTPPSLIALNSHYIFVLIRDNIRNLLQLLSQSKRLTDEDIYVLRNCVILLDHLVQKLPNVSRLLHWLTDETFLDALADCLNHLEKISKKDRTGHAVKQITRLLNIFCIIQEHLPLDLHQTLFVQLLQPTINCLTSTNYLKLFRNFKSDSRSLTEYQKLYLLKCPHFLTTYNGPHIEKAMREILDTMLPRYVTILDQHIKSIQQWKRPIMRAIHNLITMIVCAEGYFSSYTYTESFRVLIKHLLNILNEQTLINKIHPKSNNIETRLIDATLVVFNVLIYEPNALDYIKQCRPTQIFRQLTKTPYETIVLNAYMMLAHTIDENKLRTSPKDSIQVLSVTVDLLQRTMATRERMYIEQKLDLKDVNRKILQLLETLNGLAQYEPIRQEISKQNILGFLIHSYKELSGLSQQVLLECLWKLSFNKQLAQQLREHRQFILTLESLSKSINDTLPTSDFRGSSSSVNRRNGTNAGMVEEISYGIEKVVDGLLWKITKEPQFREKMKELTETNGSTNEHKYKYDIMISSSHADKDIVQKIQQVLTNEGYTVWSEHNHNHEQTMETMAEGIKNSEVVIICMSDSYKRDSYCQTQAEFALMSKRHLLPLIVHGGYKPDGWLSALLNNRLSIDFGSSSFKAASELLLEEIKQQQQKKKVSDFEQTIPTTVNAGRTSPTPLTMSTKPVAPPDLSISNETIFFAVSPTSPAAVNKQHPTPTHPTSRSSTPGANTSVTPALCDKQQPTPIHPISRSSTPDDNTSATPTVIERQQTPIQPTSTPSIADSTSFGGSIATDHQLTISKHSTSKSSISEATPSSISGTTMQQQQSLSQPILRSSKSGSIISFASDIDNKQPQTSIHSISRLATPSSISSVAVNLQQQMTIQPVLRSCTPSSVSSDSSINIRRGQQRTSGPTVRGLLIPASTSSTATLDVEKRQEQATVNSLAKPPMLSIVPSNASVPTEKNQQGPPPIIGSTTRTSETNAVPSTEYAAVAQGYSMHPETRSLTNHATSSVTSATIVKKQQQQFRLRLTSQCSTSSSSSSNESILSNEEQQQKVVVHFTGQIPTTNTVLPPTPTVSTQHYHQKSLQSTSRTTVTNPVPSVVSVIDGQQRHMIVHSIPKSSIPTSDNADKQQREPSSPISRSTTPASSALVTSNGIEKQQKQMPSRANSGSKLAATLFNGSSIRLPLPTSSQIYSRETLRLPEEYLNRKTHNSIYRTLSIDSWRNNDVLDFVFDTNLYAMMPLCESMSGRALVRLLRMGHKEPSRLYDQLNQELRDRFKGLTLPMGVYTQFLIEMDALVNTVPNAVPPMLSLPSKVVERVILMPRRAQQEQLVAMQPSPLSTISTTSSNHSNTVTPCDTASGATTPYNTRIVDPSINRPASSIGQPYNFIIESAEEPIALLHQVQRYGNQLLLLDATARQHRQLQSYR